VPNYVKFIFGYEGWARRPATLSGEIPYMLPDSRERVKQALERGCYCQHDGERTASLTRRNGAAWLQCDACGSSLGSAMRRDDHPKISIYPAWRLDLIDAYHVARDAWQASRASVIEVREAERIDYIARAIEYEHWCRTSPEWKAIKERIWWRSRGHCEACLSAPAAMVHHLTYAFGKLPPAWHLRAVCSPCHQRLHCGEDDWCDYGMQR
jgi:transcription elongation factor Elf1